MDKQALAEKVKELRLRRSWSQSQLATIVNVNIRTIQRLENDGHCSHETLKAVADAFDIDVRELTALLPEETPPNYSSESRFATFSHLKTSKSKLIWAGILYLILLGGIITYIALTFHHYYSHPYFIDELNFSAQNQAYLKLLRLSGLGLALYLGIWSAVFGIWRKSILSGLIVLGSGIIISAAAYSLLPWIYFPFDQYAAGAIWLFNNTIPLLISWALVTIFIKLLLKEYQSFTYNQS